MSEPVPNVELLRSLGRLVRGLSALFWGLPTALIVCFYTAKADGLRHFGVVPPLAVTALLVYGLWQLGSFQKQERVWRNALDRARILSLINFGLSPFLYWWNRIPNQRFFLAAVLLMVLSALLFLGSINLMLKRLGAMLPDESLRQETQQFTMLNINLLFATFIVAMLYWGLGQFRTMPLWLGMIAAIMERGSFWFLVILVLLPLAMTMALLWKTKEVILDSIFSAKE
jgi:hypothetical protein